MGGMGKVEGRNVLWVYMKDEATGVIRVVWVEVVLGVTWEVLEGKLKSNDGRLVLVNKER